MLKKNRGNTDPLYIAVSVRDNFRVWRLTQELSAEEISASEIPDKTTVFRASPDDFNIALERKQLKKKKNELVLRVGSKATAMKGPKANRFYATSQGNEWFDEERGIRAAPLSQLADKVIGSRPTSHKTALGIYIGGEDSLLVMWLLNENKDYDHFKSAINLEGAFEAEGLLSRHAEMEDYQQAEVQIIDEDQLWEAYSQSRARRPYPIDTEFMGIPKFIVGATALGVSALIAFSGSSYNSIQNISSSNLQEQADKLSQQIPEVESEKESIYQEHVNAYIKDENIDFIKALNAAETVWQPSTKTVLIMDEQQARISVKLERNNGHSEHNRFHRLERMIETPTPEGFKKQPMASDKSTSEFEVVYVKQNY